MIRDRLKEMEMRITDLADYLHMSRTTLYTFIDAYDNKNQSIINAKVLKLFDYITEHPLARKKQVISFILANISEEMELIDKDENTAFSPVMKYLAEYPTTPKSKFIQLAVQTNDFDSIMNYLLKIQPLLRNRRLTDGEIELIKPYDDIRNIIDNDKEK